MERELKTIPELFIASASLYADYTALQMRNENNSFRKFTYRDFFQNSKKLSAQLLSLGIQKGDKVALLSENRPEWTISYFAVTSMGAILVPFDTKLEIPEILNFISDSGAKVLIASQTQSDRFTAKELLPKSISVFNLDSDLAAILKGPDIRQGFANTVAPDDVAEIIYTSGSTGKPKGVMLTHYNLVSNVTNAVRAFGHLDTNDNFLSVLPAYHTFETTAGMFAPILKGCTITFAESLKSHNLLRNMTETKVTMLCAVPLLYRLFYDGILRQAEEKGKKAQILFSALLSISGFFKTYLRINIGRYLFGMVHKKFGGHIRYFLSGGAAIDPDIIKNFDLMGFTIVQAYGLTETSPVISMCSTKDNVFGSVGKACPGVEIRLVDINSAGVGEITARGPNVMKGYYNNPEATAEVIKDGWFYTGDLGRFSKTGHLYITGRSKDTIVLGSGVNVYPDEVEFALQKSPFIKEICVFGLIAKDGIKKGMEEVCAAILPDMEAIEKHCELNNIKAGEATIKQILSAEVDKEGRNLAEYKKIARLFVSTDELPKTTKRNIKRFEVRKMFGG